MMVLLYCAILLLIGGNFFQTRVDGSGIAHCAGMSSDDDVKKCEEETSVKKSNLNLGSFYVEVDAHQNYIKKQLGSSWNADMEGGIFGYHSKIAHLQKLVDDVRVKTVCEVGFNAGVSALNFLFINPNVSLVSFDLYEKSYSAAAEAALRSRFPDRSITIVPGDSTVTIPTFISSLKSVTSVELRHDGGATLLLKSKVSVPDWYPLCNLIFIDGGHSKEVARQDILNMHRLVDPEYHVAVIDDFGDGEVRDAALELYETGGVIQDLREEECVYYDSVFVDWLDEEQRYIFELTSPKAVTSYAIMAYARLENQ